jgi:simple sugar transport system permease protein
MAVAYRAGIISIGAEVNFTWELWEQLLLGCSWVIWSLYWNPFSYCDGFCFWCFVGGIAAFLKVKFAANEIIVTIMLNHIAIEISNYLISDPWRDPKTTEAFTAIINPGTKCQFCCRNSFAWWFSSCDNYHDSLRVALQKIFFGYQMEVMGANEKAAEYSGIHISKWLFLQC